MPKLRVIRFKKLNITEECLKSLVALDLTELRLQFNYSETEFSDQSVLDLIRKCKKLKRLVIDNKKYRLEVERD